MTTTELKNETGFDVDWTRRAAARAAEAGEPGWSLEARKAAAEVARSLSFPDRDHELWRRTDFRSLEQAISELDPFGSAAPIGGVSDLPGIIQARLEGDDGRAALIVQRDNTVTFERVPKALASRGVIVCPMDRAVREHGDRLQTLLGSMIEPSYDWYTAISAALRSGGTFVHVPDGMELDEPVRIFQWLDGPGRIATPHSVVVLGRGSRATVMEEQLSETGDGIALHAGATEVFVGEGARLVYVSMQEWGRNVYHYANQRARVGRDAELQWVQAMLGGRMTKNNAYFDLAEQGARAFVHGFMFGDGRQHFHLHTLQRHQAENTTSDLLIKGCLKDRARSVYQGLIQVDEGAQRTDAYQANRNLLLSDTARADSIPGLEILANDVRCTHGATIGTLDDEQLFYLMARGLPRTHAQRLIVEGFFAPVLDRMPLDEVREQLRDVIRRKIG